MSDANAENQMLIANTELTKRNALLEETLLEKERTEDALQDSEKRYRRLFESAKDGILILDADTGKVVDVNPFLLQLLGYSYDELYGRHIWEIGVFKDIAASKDAFKTLQENEYIRYDDLPLQTHDGKPVAVEFVSNVYLVDHSKVIQCNIRDITERKRAMEEKRRHQEIAERLAGEMAIIAEIGRAVGSTLDINQVFERVDAEVRKLIPYDRLLVNLKKTDENGLVVAYASGVDNTGQRLGDLYQSKGTATRVVMTTRTGILIQPADAAEIKDLYPTLSATFETGLRSTMSVPLISMDEVIGSLTFRSKKLKAYTERDLRLAEKIGAQIAGAIVNAQLFNDLKRKETELRSAAREWSTSFDAMPEGISIHEADHTIRSVNRTLCRMLGKREEELIGKKCYVIFHGITNPIADCPIELTRKTLQEEHAEFFEPVLNKWLSVSSTPVLDESGHLIRIVHVIHDITERKQGEEERETTIKLLGMLNSENGFRDTLKLICTFLHDWSGCEAVGIRLRDANDFPYVETRGFPGEFVEAENSLCVKNIDGQIDVDEIGNPQLECMCGNILCGRTDPSKPFFTTHGSFWSNCTTELLATTTDSDRQARTRNRCNGEGYESVALIPLRVGTMTFGLLQLNDKRSGRFTPGFIAQMERMGDSIAISLARRKAQEELRTKDRQLSRVMETSPVGITQVDAAGTITFANLQAEKILGLARDRVTGLTYNAPLWKITDQEGNPFPDDELPFTRVTATHEPVYDVRHAIAWPDGKRVLLSINAAPLLNASGQFEGMVASLSDITEQRRMETERLRLEERVQRSERMESLGILAGGVAHDLNNVLGVLFVYTELLLEKIPEGSPLRNYVENILSSGEKGAAVIQDLLTLARRGVMVQEVVNVNGVVSGFFKTPMFERIETHHPRVTFRKEPSEELLNIKGSPIHLEKTVMNLLSNAAEAISGNGVITIRTENRYLDKPVHGYDTVKEGEYVVLTVSDTGGGISTADIGKIFEPFYTKKVMGRSGTGLGLAIVWGTVKDHDGYIDVQSEAGKGTVFTLYFPATREEAAEKKEKMPVEQYMGRGESILVVDDTVEQRDIATRILTRLGYRVQAVSGGEEAVEYLKTQKADLLVLDMIMDPGIDGLETYERVLEVNPKQKAIIVSGFSETERVKKAQDMGAGAYVRKPYLMEKIGVAVRDELRKS